jgi:ABC-type uncharacterized transport system permease subunit
MTGSGWYWLAFSTALFLGGFVQALLALRTGKYQPPAAKLVAMAAGFAAQCVFLGIRGQAAGRCPITSPQEILVFVSWSAVLLYFFLGRAVRLSLLGMFIAPMVSLFQLAALPFLWTAAVRRPAGDYWLEMHASISLLAYGAFALSCIAGVMFLVQDRLLRRGEVQGLSYELPPVTNLATAIVRLMTIGLVLLSIGIASGFGTARPPSGIHLALSVGVWLAYAVILAVKWWRGLASLETARAAVIVFGLPVITLMMLEH